CRAKVEAHRHDHAFAAIKPEWNRIVLLSPGELPLHRRKRSNCHEIAIRYAISVVDHDAGFNAVYHVRNAADALAIRAIKCLIVLRRDVTITVTVFAFVVVTEIAFKGTVAVALGAFDHLARAVARTAAPQVSLRCIGNLSSVVRSFKILREYLFGVGSAFDLAYFFQAGYAYDNVSIGRIGVIAAREWLHQVRPELVPTAEFLKLFESHAAFLSASSRLLSSSSTSSSACFAASGLTFAPHSWIWSNGVGAYHLRLSASERRCSGVRVILPSPVSRLLQPSQDRHALLLLRRH